MTPPQLIDNLCDILPTDGLDQLSAKQLMDISKEFNYFMAEQIQIAPCDHVGDVHYETIGGRYCGTCQRKMEKETVNG